MTLSMTKGGRQNVMRHHADGVGGIILFQTVRVLRNGPDVVHPRVGCMKQVLTSGAFKR